ncbi:hypothetical protein [Nocardia sp. NPDC052566]|uniref:hypothetical protein n=1 Tax=Nocardia sp. NPDC052566 TaxID=3364330 RepID=UPI0037C52F71
MATHAASRIDHPPRALEPPLGVLGAVAAALFVAGLVISTVRAGGSPFPSPFSDPADALAYFREHSGAVRTGAVLQFASAIPLAIYVATMAARLRALTRAPGAALALVGGALAATFLICSGLVSWVLTVQEVTEDPALVRALHTLAFLFGGPGNVVSTGLLIAGIAITALRARLFTGWLVWAGVVIAALGLMSALSLTFTAAAFLLPIARFSGMAWLIAVGFLLPPTPQFVSGN